jgi:hypothetical protein
VRAWFIGVVTFSAEIESGSEPMRWLLSKIR